MLPLAAWLLLCTGNAERCCNRLNIHRGYLAAGSLFFLFAAQLENTLFSCLKVNYGALFLLVVAVAVAISHKNERLIAVLFAVFSGLVAFLALRYAYDAESPALVVAVPALFCAFFLLQDAKSQMLLVLLAPMFYGACLALEEACMFGRFSLTIGTQTQLEALSLGVVLLPILWLIDSVFRRALAKARRGRTAG